MMYSDRRVQISELSVNCLLWEGRRQLNLSKKEPQPRNFAGNTCVANREEKAQNVNFLCHAGNCATFCTCSFSDVFLAITLFRCLFCIIFRCADQVMLLSCAIGPALNISFMNNKFTADW